MWVLTIYQMKRSSYLNDGKEVFYDIEESISYEAEDVSTLFAIVEATSKAYALAVTRYEIRKAVD